MVHSTPFILSLFYACGLVMHDTFVFGEGHLRFEATLA
jgi:hypothetical protein